MKPAIPHMALLVIDAVRPIVGLSPRRLEGRPALAIYAARTNARIAQNRIVRAVPPWRRAEARKEPRSSCSLAAHRPAWPNFVGANQHVPCSP